MQQIIADPSKAEEKGDMHPGAGRTWPACMNYHKKACKDSTWAVLIRHIRRTWALAYPAALKKSKKNHAGHFEWHDWHTLCAFSINCIIKTKTEAL